MSPKARPSKKNIDCHWCGDNVTKIFTFNITIIKEEGVTVSFSTFPVLFSEK